MKDQLQQEVSHEVHRLNSELQALRERVEQQEVSKEKMETVSSVVTSQESLRESHESLEKRWRKMSLQLSLFERRAEDAAGEAESQLEALREALLSKFREEKQTTEVLRKDVEDLRGSLKGNEKRLRSRERLVSLTRRKVPEGRRHACWQGCPRCQGTRTLVTRSPQRDLLHASDFADAFKGDKASDVHDLVDAMEASCSRA